MQAAILNGDKKTGVTRDVEDAKKRWEQYGNGQRQIAFHNGFPVAFNSSGGYINTIKLMIFVVS